MSLTIIAAVSKNNVIGNLGKIPWYIPEDLIHFKRLTLNHPVIMGRKTYESIPERFRPLEKRKNIILTNSLNESSGIYIARSIEEALSLTENEDSYIIGGKTVYESFLPRVTRLEITRVNHNYEGDTFFPKVNWNEWELVDRIDKIDYSFLTYLRKANLSNYISQNNNPL